MAKHGPDMAPRVQPQQAPIWSAWTKACLPPEIAKGIRHRAKRNRLHHRRRDTNAAAATATTNNGKTHQGHCHNAARKHEHKNKRKCTCKRTYNRNDKRDEAPTTPPTGQTSKQKQWQQQPQP